MGSGPRLKHFVIDYITSLKSPFSPITLSDSGSRNPQNYGPRPPLQPITALLGNLTNFYLILCNQMSISEIETEVMSWTEDGSDELTDYLHRYYNNEDREINSALDDLDSLLNNLDTSVEPFGNISIPSPSIFHSLPPTCPLSLSSAISLFHPPSLSFIRHLSLSSAISLFHTPSLSFICHLSLFTISASSTIFPLFRHLLLMAACVVSHFF